MTKKKSFKTLTPEPCKHWPFGVTSERNLSASQQLLHLHRRQVQRHLQGLNLARSKLECLSPTTIIDIVLNLGACSIKLFIIVRS